MSVRCAIRKLRFDLRWRIVIGCAAAAAAAPAIVKTDRRVNVLMVLTFYSEIRELIAGFTRVKGLHPFVRFVASEAGLRVSFGIGVRSRAPTHNLATG